MHEKNVKRSYVATQWFEYFAQEGDETPIAHWNHRLENGSGNPMRQRPALHRSLLIGSVRDDVRLRVFDTAKRLKSVFTCDALTMAGQKTRCIIRAISHERLNRAAESVYPLWRVNSSRENSRAGIWSNFVPWNGSARLDDHRKKNGCYQERTYNYRKMWLKQHSFLSSFAFWENIQQNQLLNLHCNFRRHDYEPIIYN